MSGCNEVETSWAWISPSGDFIPVSDHGTWAVENPRFRRDIIMDWVHDDDGPEKLMSPGGWSYQGKKKVRLSPETFWDMVERIIKVGTGDKLWETDPPTSSHPSADRVENIILPEVMARPDVMRRIKNLPHLSAGSWSPSSRLTNPENDFVFWADDLFGEEEWYKVTHTRIPHRGEESLMAAWDSLRWYYSHNVRHFADRHLIGLGWMRATNPFAVEVANVNNTAQWDSFFKEGMSCYTHRDPIPMTFYVSSGKDSQRYSEITFGEALQQFASRKVSDQLFGMALEKWSKTAEGQTFTYEVGEANPSGDGNSYQYVKDVEEKKVPPGHGDPEKHLDDADPASGRVVPPGTGEMWSGDATYMIGSSSRVAIRYASTMADIVRKTSPTIVRRSQSVDVSPKRFDPQKGMWIFQCTGSKGESYTIRLKGIRKSNITDLKKAEVQVSCTCNFFRWQGPEHWGKVHGYLYGRPVGTASQPVVKDPPGKHWACKHVLAALELAKKYRFSSEDPGWSFNGRLTPFPSPLLVALRYLEQ